jgi:hypothetical protein
MVVHSCVGYMVPGKRKVLLPKQLPQAAPVEVAEINVVLGGPVL